MNETIATIIEKIIVRHKKPTPLPDGRLCTEFYDCARLSPSDLARLAAQATGHLTEEEFDAVVGIAYSGILYGAAVAGGRQMNILQKDGELYGPPLKGKKVLLVDDVVASGTHMQAAEKKVVAAGAGIFGYACVVDRSNGAIGDDAKPLLSALQAPL